MMLERHQLPVYSPVRFSAITRAARGFVGNAGTRAKLTGILCDEYAAASATLTDSGTSALALALAHAAACRENLPAALPAYSCWDLASAAIGAGVRVVLYDIDPHTLTPDRASLQRALAAGVSSVVIVHLYGLPVDIADLQADVLAAGAVVVEDAAQAFGAWVSTARAGSHGDYTVLSFGRGKGLSGGGGGALLARHGRNVDCGATLGSTASSLRAVTVLTAQWLLGRPSLYSAPASLPRLRLGETVYHPQHEPAAASNATVHAVLANWRAAETEAGLRATRAAWLLERCSAQFERIGIMSHVHPSFLRLPLLAPTGTAARVRTRAARRLGIMPGYPTALADLPELQPSLLPSGSSFTGARELAERLLTVPVHARLTRRDMESIVAWTDDAVCATQIAPTGRPAYSAAGRGT